MDRIVEIVGSGQTAQAADLDSRSSAPLSLRELIEAQDLRPRSVEDEKEVVCA